MHLGVNSACTLTCQVVSLAILTLVALLATLCYKKGALVQFESGLDQK